MTLDEICKWEWLGHPGHFIAADKCLFRLHTHVGAGAVRYCVSTVGDFYMGKEAGPIGFNRMFETMVFRLDASGGHDGKNIDFRGYMHASSANDGHVDLCQRWHSRAVASNHDDGVE